MEEKNLIWKLPRILLLGTCLIRKWVSTLTMGSNFLWSCIWISNTFSNWHKFRSGQVWIWLRLKVWKISRHVVWVKFMYVVIFLWLSQNTWILWDFKFDFQMALASWAEGIKLIKAIEQIAELRYIPTYNQLQTYEKKTYFLSWKSSRK